MFVAFFQGDASEKIAFPLLVLLAKARQWIGIVTGATAVEYLTDWTDAANETFQQYVDFLSGTMAPEAYQQFLPSIDVFANLYGIDPAAAFYAYRPLFRVMDGTEPEDGEIDMAGDDDRGDEVTAQNGHGHGLTFGEVVRGAGEFQMPSGREFLGDDGAGALRRVLGPVAAGFGVPEG